MPISPHIAVAALPFGGRLQHSGFYRYTYPSPRGRCVNLEDAIANHQCAEQLLEEAAAIVRWHLGAARLERTNPKGSTPTMSRRLQAHHMAHVLHAQTRVVRLAEDRRAWFTAIQQITGRSAA